MKTLKKGSVGSLVAMLQLALNRADAYAGEEDGIFGSATQRAVLRYQNENGLTADGIVGTATWNSLKKYISGYTLHRITPGDTFFKLAKQYGSSAEAIAQANPYAPPERLQIGAVIVVPFGYSIVPTSIPYSHELLTLIIAGLKARYPFLRVIIAGKSVMGKDIYCLSIGIGIKQLSWNAAHHANEWITTPVMLKYIEEYLRAYSKGEAIYGEDAGALYYNTRLFALPMVNPDGVELVTGALSDGDYYENARKIAADYPGIPFPDGWKANIAGTDLNLNYPAGWEEARRIKYSLGFTSPAPQNFVGPRPLSAPESRAVYNLTRRYDFRLVIAYHTQGREIYWQFQNYNPPRALEIGQALSRASGYTLAEVPYNSSFAGYKDWFIQDYNRPGYTVEAGLGVNPLPLSQFDEIYESNKGIFTASLREA